MFKKSSKLFDREGFYIVLFVCLCIVAVTAVYITRSNTNHPAKKVAQNPQTTVGKPATSINPVLTDKPTDSVPTSKQKGLTKDQVAAAMKKSTKTTTKAATKKTTKKVVRENFKIAYPVKGEIVKKYDNKELQLAKAMPDKQWETHEGIDIQSEIGSEVKAASDGKVVEVITNDEKATASEKNGFGIAIVIDHNGNYRTVYSNLALESLKVKKGDKVKVGQVIGYVGDTSVREATSIEGSHLHFELLKKSGKDYVTVNPTQYLK
jgi:murein DD-endopeptidase MepM/ murein hydrolase activator NlpD